MSQDRRLIDAVDRVVREHGEYIPVEYLLAVGRLRYPDYETWRCGEADSLEAVVIGNPVRVVDELRRAAQRAQELGLMAEQHRYDGWAGASGRRLKLGARTDSQSDDLYCTHFVRRKTVHTGQFDLFLDGGASALVHRLGSALIERRIDEAASLLAELEHRERDHPLSGALAALCEAQRELGGGGAVGSEARELARIESGLAPAAGQALGPRARDFLAPFWRRLGDALAGFEFDPATPRLHASWVYRQVLDWPRVEASIRKQRDWHLEPELNWRLAEALHQQSRRHEAIALWCRLCWSWPALWESRLQSAEVPDPLIVEYWREFTDADIDPALEPAWFPAWMLMQEKGLSRALEPLATSSVPPQQGFGAVGSLMTNRGVVDENTLAARQLLKSLHTGLFEYYLERHAAIPER